MMKIGSLVLLLGLFSVTATAEAGPFTDDMAKCLVHSTSPADKTTLMKWIFVAMSAHPDVKSLSAVTDEQAEAVASDAGKLLMDLLTDRCREETRQAIQYEGESAIQASFSVLGQVAMQGLMSNADVSAYLGAVDRYVDGEKLKAALAPKNDAGGN